MEAVGGEVWVALLFPVITLTSLGIYYRRDVREFIASQTNLEVRIE